MRRDLRDRIRVVGDRTKFKEPRWIDNRRKFDLFSIVRVGAQ